MRVSKTVFLVGIVTMGVIALGVGQLLAGPTGPDGRSVIEASAAAYRSAPALTDTIRIRVEQPNGSEEEQFEMAIGASGDAELRLQGFVFASIGPKVFIRQETLPSKYVEVPLQDNLLDTIRSITNGQAAFPAPGLLLRYADTPDEQVNAFGLGLVNNLQLTGHETVQADGQSYDRLQFAAENGVEVTARIDQGTRLVKMVELKRAPLVYTFTMDPARHETLPEAIRFDPAGRRKVADLSKLSLGEGDPAPDFTLESLDGQPIKLSALRGKVIVLDFWATWCGPCKKGLPELQKFADWASENDKAVMVFPVNMGERQPTEAAKRQFVSSFWKKAGYGMTTLLDLDNAVARQYQVGPIPHTVVIGPDGTIIKVKIGFDPAMSTVLRETATEALSTPG
ncbi:MAG: TlpA family protein disulfide reductase [Planctomycetota bacterium]|jgi:thiol-disulfide isomerase/thioredoxin